MYYIITKKSLFLSLMIITLMSIFTISCIVFASSNTSWGLSFQVENEPPIGNASSEELSKYNAYFMGDKTKKEIYLTFDVGYEAGYTENILDTLKKHNVKAAFFIVGNYFSSNPDTVKRMYEEGHIVGNHTKTHPDMSKMSTLEEFKSQIQPVEEQYKQITGQDMKKFYRPPQGV